MIHQWDNIRRDAVCTNFPAWAGKPHSCQNQCVSITPIENPGMQTHMCVDKFQQNLAPNSSLCILLHQGSNRCNKELGREDRRRRRRRQSPHLSISIPVIKKGSQAISKLWNINNSTDARGIQGTITWWSRSGGGVDIGQGGSLLCVQAKVGKHDRWGMSKREKDRDRGDWARGSGWGPEGRIV